MDDEQSQAEPTAVEETQEQTTVTEDAGSEAVTTPSEDAGKGDLRVPLKEERERRQRLEESLNDPDFIYKRAQELGMAQAEEQAPRVPQAPLTAAQVRTQIRAEKAMEKYPELATNSKLQIMASALVQGGMDPVEAADEIFGFAKRNEEKAKVEASTEAKAEIGEREKAQMAGNPVRTNSETERLSEIQKNMRSPVKATQEAAALEWLKAKNEKDGII